MIKISKLLSIFVIIIAAVMLFSMTKIAQGFHEIIEFPAFFAQPLSVPVISPTTGDILIDHFEYFDSPYNHGWRQVEPPYPVYGYGLGYATIFNTVLDLQEGSRVLDVYRPASVFLLGTPYQKHQILYQLPGIPTVAQSEDDTVNGIVSFDFRAPLGIEPWDIFEMVILGITDPNAPEGVHDPGATPHTVNVVLTPIEPPAGSCIGPLNTTGGMYGMLSAVQAWNEAQGQLTIRAALGRGLLDGSWHAVWVDLPLAVESAVEAYNAGKDAKDQIPMPEWQIAVATGVLISGQMFRLDNLFFRATPGHVLGDYPDFFEMGPLYAQLFEPYRYLFISDYAGAGHPGSSVTQDRIIDFMHDPNNFLFVQDPNDPDDPVVRYWTDLGADPNLFGDTEGDPALKDIFGRIFFVDLSLPIFANPDLRMDPNTGKPASELSELITQGHLGWNLTVNSYGANAIQTVGALNPLFINPYDGIPTYVPSYYAAVDCIMAFGKPFYPSMFVYTLEGAMWNAGIPFWPNIATLDYTPYYFEDLILTIEVTNGVHSDVRTFPLSVVNYPVENYPPVLQLDIDDQIYYVGEGHEYLINFIDPDCFIFSMAQQPATTHVPGFPLRPDFRTDMESLVWSMTLNGLPSYQYGPWIEQIIQPSNGLISWIPKFEGAYDVVVTCTDARGASGFGEITIFAVNKGTWLNHPPIILGGPTQPVVMNAGEEFILHEPNFDVEDPDGDAIYASCNIGTCGRGVDGSFIWKFQSNFPGAYLVEIIFYDIRGGYAIMEFFLDVKPWWSY